MPTRIFEDREQAGLADEVECLETPSPFRAVGLYYRDFSPVEDEQVMALLRGSGSAA